MRVVVWNCNQGLHKKLDTLMALGPDLAIIPECAEPSVVKAKAHGISEEVSFEWVGDSPQKGLGVIAFNGLSLARDANYDPLYQYFLPLHLGTLSILAVWAFNRRTRTAVDPERPPTIQALEYYEPWFRKGPLIVAGDFNSWHRTDKPSSFLQAAEILKSVRVESSYHLDRGCEFGSEPEATHFYRKSKRAFHIDYCFVPPGLLRRVELGKREEWLVLSDHVPLIVDFDIDP